MSLRINDTAPDFTADTTEGPISFHQWIGDGWAILFSHPRAFTPVCTTELGYMQSIAPEFAKRGAKILGISVDPVENQDKWKGDIETATGHRVTYPLIGDPELKVAKLYDMLPAEAPDSWEGRTPADNQSLKLEYDTSKQVYDNTPYVNNLGTETYPLGTVDGLAGLWRAAPQVGYASDQKFSRDQWALTHQGQWDFGNSQVTLSHIDTGNHGRTLPFSVDERLVHRSLYCNNAATCATGPYAGMARAQRQQLMVGTFLPRPKRTMDSSQYTLDAKLDIPLESRLGSHHLVVGGQAIDGELEDGVFGMEGGSYGNGTVQEHRMWSLFAEDYPASPAAKRVTSAFDAGGRRLL